MKKISQRFFRSSPITITQSFQTTTPESAIEGDFDDYGWIDEEGTKYDTVEEAANHLKMEGVMEKSTSNSCLGSFWYDSNWFTSNYSTGEEKQHSYHVKGTPKQELAVCCKLFNGHHGCEKLSKRYR